MSEAEFNPNDLADRATDAATSGMEMLKRFTVGYDAEALRAAWSALHESGRSSVAAASDEETWIRQAAMMLLVGLEAVSRDATGNDDGGEPAELEDHASEQMDQLVPRGVVGFEGRAGHP